MQNRLSFKPYFEGKEIRINMAEKERERERTREREREKRKYNDFHLEHTLPS